MPTLVLSPSSTMPAAQTSGVPQLDIEWAPASAPGDAPSWRSLVGQPDGVLALQTKVGRPQELQRFSAGTATVSLENWKRLLDPDNPASPVVGMAVPNRQFRIVARIGGVTYYLFQGYLDGLPQAFGFPVPDPVMSLNATDVNKLLARKSLPKSMYELAVATDRPQNWWKLDEAVLPYAQDSGFAATLLPGAYTADSFFPAFPNVTGVQTTNAPQPGQTAIVPYDGSRTATTFTHGANRVSVNGGGAVPVASYPFSIEAWINCVSSTADLRYIYWQANFPNEGGQVRLLVANTGGGWGGTATGDRLLLSVSNNGVTRETQSTVSVATGSAVHVVATAVDASTFTVYVNGVSASSTLFTSGGGTPAIPSTNVVSALGGTPILPGNGTFGLEGSMTNVAIYNYALTATQVLDHYNAGANAFLAEDTGTRLGRVLNYLGFPSMLRSIQTGNSVTGSYDLAGGKGVDYVQTLADTEQNQWYADGQGNLVWRSRQDALTASRTTTSQATFSDAAGATLQYARLQYDLNELNIYNDVTVTRTNGADRRVQDFTSQRKYFPQSFSISGGLQRYDNDSFDCANWILQHHADPPNRIIGLELEPIGDTTLFAQALGRSIGDRITVVRTIAGNTVSSDFVIEGVEHSFSPTSIWLTVFRLSPAETQQYWVLGDATLSVLGSTTRVAF